MSRFEPSPHWPTKEGLLSAAAFVLMIGAVLLVFTVWAFGADLAVIGATSPDFHQQSIFVFETPPFAAAISAELRILDYDHEVGITFQTGDIGYTFAPSVENTDLISLGLPARPFKHGFFSGKVSANKFNAAGQDGLTRTLHIGGFIVQVQGGLIVGCFDQFGQACP